MTDVFNQETLPVIPPVAPTNGTPPDYSAYLGLIRNENGEQKYSSIEKALEALAHTQSFIPHIKTENETLKAQLAELQTKVKSQETIEEAIARIAAQKESRESHPSAASGLDEQAVATIFQQLLERKEVEKTVSSNRELVSKALTQKFGDKVQEAIAAKAQELGMSTKDLGDLASRAPQAALQLFNTGAPKGATPTASSYSTPLSPAPEDEIKRPEKSLLMGATHKEQADFMRRIREASEKKHGITR
jgi:YesN/AraC family two-component response regulator